MTKHTPEPWRRGNRFPSRVIAEGAVVAYGSSISDEKAPSEQEIANARRIVACVNACAGIPTEALESGVLGGALAALGHAGKFLHAWGQNPKGTTANRTHSFNTEASYVAGALAKLGLG